MKNLKYLIIMGLVGLLFSCEKDETKVIFSDSPVVPTLQTVPDLSLKRANAATVVTFAGTLVDPGFKASATYFLEACKTGNNFVDAVTLYSGIQDTVIKMSTADLNGLLLKKFTADATTSIDLRLRAILVVDAGTGAKGTSTQPFEYKSAVKTVNATPYGLPRLDLNNSGLTQKIESPAGDGKYIGYVKLDPAKSFTLKDPDTNTTYGVTAGKLAANGTALSVTDGGWYILTADTKALTYNLEKFFIGLVGSATANNWDSPDQKMDYVTGTGDPKMGTGSWKITTPLKDGEFKFRLNDGWAWNLGWNSGKTGLTHNGDNIAATTGNYTITMTITVYSPVGVEAGTFTIVKN